MIIGKIKDNREAFVELEVIGSNAREKVGALIDTGFTESLMLPTDIIHRLGLTFVGDILFILADGSTRNLNLYDAKVLWHAEERDVSVVGTDEGALVGMALLEGSRLTVDVVKDGKVTIEALP